MARPQFPSIDRRRLLVSAAALPVAGIVPELKRADAAAADVFQSSPLTFEAEPANSALKTEVCLVWKTH
jgi:hypothetical protein